MQETIDDFRDRLNRLTEVGIAISAELNLDVLLEKIVHHARELTRADAGTLYLLQDGALHFKIVQNATLGVYEGGTDRYINLPPVALDKANVSAYVALTRTTVNVPDVYASEQFDFTGPRKYDARTGYRSKSMLVTPMVGHAGELIGVLQLMNATDPATGEIGAFPDGMVDLTRALASQAAVAIANASLVEETKALFESLIRVLAVAIDAKSRYTGNHVQRVAEFTMWIARAINDTKEGRFAGFTFTADELEELRLAGWLHDVGKVTTPVWVMDKSTKLETIIDRIEMVKLRYELFRRMAELKAAQAKLAFAGTAAGPAAAAIDQELAADLKRMDEEIKFIADCNKPGEFMDDGKLKRLEEVAKRLCACGEVSQPAITSNEKYNLSIRKGSLTSEELGLMRDHVVWSKRMLDEVPFKRSLQNVPLYAGQHHEKLDGSGYPNGLKGDQIPIQSRIVAIADFYEALSAKDRPYKPAMPVEKIFAILKSAADKGEIDKDILDLITRDKVHEKFEAAYDAV